MLPFATDEIAWTQLFHARTARGARTVAQRLATLCTQISEGVGWTLSSMIGIIGMYH